MDQNGIGTRTLELAGGARITVDTAGDGPAVILLHGVGGHRGQWHRQLCALSGDFGVVAWDMRNYGDSSGPPVLRFADFADDLFGVLDALRLTRVVAAGHSMGGRVLIEAALTDPSRFAGLVLAGAQPAYLEHMSDEARRAYIGKRTAMFEDGKVNAATADRVATDILPPHADAALRTQIADSLARLRPDGYIAALAASNGWSRVEDVARLDMPVAVLGGALDTVCPPAECHRLAAALGQGPAQILEGVGHMAQIEAPDRVTDVIRAMAAAHSPRADRFRAARQRQGEGDTA